MKNKGLVVLSGGQDSTTTALFARKECKELHGVTFDYGQKHKIEIKSAVEQKFDVKVEKVATMNRQGKLKEMTMKSGGRTIRTRGKRSGWKKAIITLIEGYSIDLIRGESGV